LLVSLIKRKMAGGTEISEISLSEIFDKALQLHEDLDNSTEDTVSESYQNKVKKEMRTTKKFLQSI